VRARSKARSWALQVLYAWESRGLDTPARTILHDFEEERSINDESRGYMRELVNAVAEHRTDIDVQLDQALTNWRLERLSVIDRNILRLAAAEMLFGNAEDVPPAVSIQEAIVLAEKYGTQESPRFVNGVLDALRKTVDRSE
jgi:transcription antitermination protein NusB